MDIFDPKHSWTFLTQKHSWTFLTKKTFMNIFD